MKHCGCLNVSKHRYIKDGEKYITFDISLKFVTLEKMKITSPESKDYLVISRKEFVTYLGINTIERSKRIQKERGAIPNVSLKDISKIIKGC